MHPLEIITHKSPRSFPHTVWIPHAEMHASVQIPARTQLCRMLAVKTVPAPFALHSLSPAQHWTVHNSQIVDNDKNACIYKIELPVDKCTGVIPHKMFPIVLIMKDEDEVKWWRKRLVFRCRWKIVRDSAFRRGSS